MKQNFKVQRTFQSSVSLQLSLLLTQKGQGTAPLETRQVSTGVLKTRTHKVKHTGAQTLVKRRGEAGSWCRAF